MRFLGIYAATIQGIPVSVGFKWRDSYGYLHLGRQVAIPLMRRLARVVAI